MMTWFFKFYSECRSTGSNFFLKPAVEDCIALLWALLIGRSSKILNIIGFFSSIMSLTGNHLSLSRCFLSTVMGDVTTCVVANH